MTPGAEKGARALPVRLQRKLDFEAVATGPPAPGREKVWTQSLTRRTGSRVLVEDPAKTLAIAMTPSRDGLDLQAAALKSLRQEPCLTLRIKLAP